MKKENRRAPISLFSQPLWRGWRGGEAPLQVLLTPKLLTTHKKDFMPGTGLSMVNSKTANNT